MEQNRSVDRFFAGLMIVCFLASAMILGKNRVEKQRSEKQMGIQAEMHAEMQEEIQEQEFFAPEMVAGEETAPPVSEEDGIAKDVPSAQSVSRPVYEGEYRKPGTEGLEIEMEAPQKFIPIFVTVGYDYFDDALLIGDSRMEGIKEYGNLTNATFFADAGMSVFKLEQKALTVPGMGKLTFDEVLTARQYGKIYLMLGLNELGYKFEAVEEKYGEIVAKIRENQSEAVIYLCANLHVTAKQSQKDSVFNNANVDRVNGMIKGLTDGKHCIFLDANEIFDDENGGLRADYSSDAFHIYAKHYMEWVDWLCTKGI